MSWARRPPGKRSVAATLSAIRGESGVAVTIARHRDGLDGLGSEDVAGGVETVDPDVLQRSAPMGRIETVVVVAGLKGEDRRKQARLADLAAAHALQKIDRARIAVQSVGGHQQGAGIVRGGDHLLALRDAGRERLLHHRVPARPEGADREVGVQGVGQGDVDGVDQVACHQIVVLLVSSDAADAVELCELPGLLGAAADDGGDLGVAGLRNARDERLLRDASRADHCVSNPSHRVPLCGGLPPLRWFPQGADAVKHSAA